jgi:pimeloyl-ACP methyl ester carboxylesterase
MFVHFGGSGPALYFAHANGYPPATYAPLFEHLAPHFQVTALLARPLWPHSQPDPIIRDWSPYVDDLMRFFDERGETGVLAVGHSLGAVCLLAAALRRPELFRALVLIDPVLFRQGFLLMWDTLRGLGLAHRVHPLIPGALRRRRVFASVDDMFTRYRRAPVFARLSDDHLRVYVGALARPRADGQVELAYSPEWEVKIYETGPLNLWRDLPNLRPPLAIIYGAESDTFLPPAARKVQRALPAATLHAIPEAGHLAPLEKPAETGKHITQFFTSFV